MIVFVKVSRCLQSVFAMMCNQRSLLTFLCTVHCRELYWWYIDVFLFVSLVFFFVGPKIMDTINFLPISMPIGDTPAATKLIINRQKEISMFVPNIRKDRKNVLCTIAKCYQSHDIATSSLWLQSLMPMPLCLQRKRSSSFPWQLTSSSQMTPVRAT